MLGLADPKGTQIGSKRMLWQLQAIVFVLNMLKVGAVVLRLMQPHSLYLGCHCVAAEMLAMVLCAPGRL